MKLRNVCFFSLGNVFLIAIKSVFLKAAKGGKNSLNSDKIMNQVKYTTPTDRELAEMYSYKVGKENMHAKYIDYKRVDFAGYNVDGDYIIDGKYIVSVNWSNGEYTFEIRDNTVIDEHFDKKMGKTKTVEMLKKLGKKIRKEQHLLFGYKN